MKFKYHTHRGLVYHPVSNNFPILHPILRPSFLRKSLRRYPFEIANTIAPQIQSSTKLATASHAKKPCRQVVHDAPLSRPITTANVNGIPHATAMTNGSRIISSLLRTVPAWSDFDDRHLKAAALLQKSLRCLRRANAFCSQSIHLALSGVITSRAKFSNGRRKSRNGRQIYYKEKRLCIEFLL